MLLAPHALPMHVLPPDVESGLPVARIECEYDRNELEFFWLGSADANAAPLEVGLALKSTLDSKVPASQSIAFSITRELAQRVGESGLGNLTTVTSEAAAWLEGIFGFSLRAHVLFAYDYDRKGVVIPSGLRTLFSESVVQPLVGGNLIPARYTCARALAKLWWGGVCRVPNTRGLEATEALSAALAIRYLRRLGEDGAAEGIISRLRRVAAGAPSAGGEDWVFNEARQARATIAFAEVLERAGSLVSLRQATSRSVGTYLKVDALFAALGLQTDDGTGPQGQSAGHRR